MSTTSPYLEALRETLARISADALAAIGDALARAWEADRQILICGNGGSAATASHFANDLCKGAAGQGRPPRAIALTDSVPLLTAWANDTEYARVFEAQLLALGRPGDLLVAISGSGNSPNVLRAVAAARARGLETAGLCGFAGGALAAMVDHPLVVRSESMEQIEDCHLAVCHALALGLRAVIGAQPVAAGRP